MSDRKPDVRVVHATGSDDKGEWEYVKLIWYNQNHDVIEFRREYK